MAVVHNASAEVQCLQAIQEAYLGRRGGGLDVENVPLPLYAADLAQEFYAVMDYFYHCKTGRRIPYDAPMHCRDAAAAAAAALGGCTWEPAWLATRRMQGHEDMHAYHVDRPRRTSEVRSVFNALFKTGISLACDSGACCSPPRQVPTLYVPNVTLSSDRLRQIADAVCSSAAARGTTEVCIAACDVCSAKEFAGFLCECAVAGIASVCMRKADFIAVEGASIYLEAVANTSYDGDAPASLSMECVIYEEWSRVFKKFWRSVGADASLRSLVVGGLDPLDNVLFMEEAARGLSANRTLQVLRFSFYTDEQTCVERGRMRALLAGLLRGNSVLRSLELPPNLLLSGETLAAVIGELRAGGGAALRTLGVGASRDDMTDFLRELVGAAPLPLGRLLLSLTDAAAPGREGAREAARALAGALGEVLGSCCALKELEISVYSEGAGADPGAPLLGMLPSALAGARALEALTLRGAELDARACGELGRALGGVESLRELSLAECHLADNAAVVGALPPQLRALRIKAGTSLGAVVCGLHGRARGSASAAAALTSLSLDFRAHGILDGGAVAALADLLAASRNLRQLTLLLDEVDEAHHATYNECIAMQTVTGSLGSVHVTATGDGTAEALAAVLREHPLRTRLRELRLGGSPLYGVPPRHAGLRLAVSAAEAARQESQRDLSAWRVVREQVDPWKARAARCSAPGAYGFFAHVPSRAIDVITRCVGADHDAGGCIALVL